MKKILAIIIALLATSTVFSATAQPAATPLGLGSCYEMKPMCMGNVICVCNQNNDCIWMCTR